jgi:hypothetical protein
MAHTVLLISVGTPSIEIPNIDHSVGATSGSNRPDDVMLVQAYLRLFFYEIKKYVEFNVPPTGHSTIAIDGKCGKATQDHIRQLKVAMRKYGMPTLADGKIDPVPWFYSTGGYAATKHRGDFYVLDILLSRCSGACLAEGRMDLYRMKSRTDVPLALRNALETVKVTE